MEVLNREKGHECYTVFPVNVIRKKKEGYESRKQRKKDNGG
jgi:hypothetical protein